MFKVLDEVCQPTRATRYSAMVDLYAREDVVIGAGATKIVPLGVKIDLECLRENRTFESCGIFEDEPSFDEGFFNDFLKSHYLELHPRSSLRAKGLIIGVGVVDLDYPDEIGLIVHNTVKTKMINPYPRACYLDASFEQYTINKGDKIAQCTLKEHKGYLLGIESDVERCGGYGSTDKEKK